MQQQTAEQKQKQPEQPSEADELKVIPRLVDSAGQAAIQRGSKDSNLDPRAWTCDDVAEFLEINECGSLVEAFIEQVQSL